MPLICDQCRKSVKRTTKTMTGRDLCQPCQDELLGLTAGVLSSGSDVGQSIAVAGWYARLRARRRGGS